jgi:hypothetical protein
LCFRGLTTRSGFGELIRFKNPDVFKILLSLSKASDTDLMESRLGWTQAVIAQLATQVDQHLVLRFIETQETHSLPDTTIQVALHHLPVLPPPEDNAAVLDDDGGGRWVHGLEGQDPTAMGEKADTDRRCFTPWTSQDMHCFQYYN